MRKLIGFAGAKGAGKTTAARMLIDSGFRVRSYATPLKQFLRDFMNFSEEQINTLKGKETVDPRYGVSPRRVMEAFGTDFVRNVVPDLWVMKMAQAIEDGPDQIAIDDIRFEDEAKLVRDRGGVVIHIAGRGMNLAERANPVERARLPRSERGILVMEGDMVIDNSGSKDDLLDQLLGCL